MSVVEHKAVRLFPKIHSLKDFLCTSHPKYHPDTKQYSIYWENQEKKCLEGVWGFDGNSNDVQEKQGYRYMPGFLYYYVNICKIIDEDEKGNSTTIINPLLRDVEWLFSYGWLTCRGFSGFADDPDYTSFRLVEKVEKKQKLSHKEARLLKKVGNAIHKEDGSYKEYIEARKYLYKTHEKPLGVPLYQNQALNFFILGPRGWGKSFIAANAVIGHEYNFYGKKHYDSDYLLNPSPVEIFVGSGIAAKSAELLKKFQLTQTYLKKEIGAYGKGRDFIPGVFYSNNSGTLKPNNSDSPYQHYYRYKENNEWLEGGTGSKIMHGVYTTENPQAAVGTRPTVMVIEEVGLLGNLLNVHGANETCQVRRTKFGSSLYIGTGGNMEKVTESKIVFEDPTSYGFIGYQDHWEGRADQIGFFLPAYYVDNDFKDELGNTDVEASLAQELLVRKEKSKAANSSAIDEYVMARPIVPSDMFLTPGTQIFPTQKLRERLAYLSIRNVVKSIASIGTLDYENQEKKSVIWTEDIIRKLKPINTLNIDSHQKAGNMFGAIVIYEHPPDDLPPAGWGKSLYKVCYDPVKDDKWGTSLASIIVHKGYADKDWEGGIQDSIVAEWIGRPETVAECHEIAIKLAHYYSTRVMVENNIPDFIRYCRMRVRPGYYNQLRGWL